MAKRRLKLHAKVSRLLPLLSDVIMKIYAEFLLYVSIELGPCPGAVDTLRVSVVKICSFHAFYPLPPQLYVPRKAYSLINST